MNQLRLGADWKLCKLTRPVYPIGHPQSRPCTEAIKSGRPARRWSNDGERIMLYLPTTLRHVKNIRNEYCVVAELFLGQHSDASAARPSRGKLAG